MFKKITLASALAVGFAANAFAAPGFTVEGNNASVLVYGVVGTGGVGAGAGFQPAKDVVLRAELSQYTKSYTKNESNIAYSGDLKLSTQAIYADYHPFGGAFRVTGGVEFGGPKADMLAKQSASGTYTVNGTTYAVTASEQIAASLKYPSTMPYIGIGWGLGDFSKPGFRLGVDMGANIGKPKATLTASGALTSDPQFAADLDAENKKLSDDVSRVKFFPVVKISVGYAF